MDALERAFRPEFINRVDEIIVFEPLTREDVLEIVGIMLSRMNKHLESQRVSVEVTQAAKEFIAEQGYDPKFGARPLARAIRRYVENPLSSRIIGGEFDPGDTVVVDRAGDGGTSLPSRRRLPLPSSRTRAANVTKGLRVSGSPFCVLDFGP
jgi:ATP-dependent Clp protease ATP-binding subunit ClpA